MNGRLLGPLIKAVDRDCVSFASPKQSARQLDRVKRLERRYSPASSRVRPSGVTDFGYDEWVAWGASRGMFACDRPDSTNGRHHRPLRRIAESLPIAGFLSLATPCTPRRGWGGKYPLTRGRAS
jgi:hypothetical protein